MSSSPSQTVLISGITGFIATEIALAFLEAGYTVRGTVRSLAKAEPWKALHAKYADHLQFVEVPDITVAGAFDEAVKDVDFVIHAASPLPAGNLADIEGDYLKPAINGTLAALRSASTEPRVKKVVITSSIASVVDRSQVEKARNEEGWSPITYEFAVQVKNPGIAYSASKKLAEEAAWKYVEEEKPSYAVVTLLPSFVYGPSHQPGNPIEGTNKYPAAILLATSEVDYAKTPGAPAFVDVRDVAHAHLLAVTNPKADGQRFIISSPEIFPSEYPAYFVKAVPSLADTLPRVPEGFTNGPTVKLDTTKSEEVLGLTYRPHEETLGDVAKYILKASGKSVA